MFQQPALGQQQGPAWMPPPIPHPIAHFTQPVWPLLQVMDPQEVNITLNICFMFFRSFSFLFQIFLRLQHRFNLNYVDRTVCCLFVCLINMLKCHFTHNAKKQKAATI